MPPSSSSSIASSAAPRPGAIEFAQKSVLLLDDEIAYIDLLEQLLGEHLACPVHSFFRPTEALKALPSLDVGLIVTDYHMPAMTGFEFLLEVKKLRPTLPAVMITGHQIELTPEWETRLPQLKAIVKKPFKWTVLAEEISRHWTGSRPPFPLTGH
jgi:DNA-binding NtrC family response regulator